MQRKMTLLFLLLCLVISTSCGKSGGGSNAAVNEALSTDMQQPAAGAESSDEDTLTGSSDQPAETVAEAQKPVKVETDAITFETNIKMFKFTSAGRKKILAAADLIKAVVASEEFKKKVLNHKVNGRRTFVDNGGLTNAQIYQKILDGAEQLRRTKDNEMDLEVELYSDNTNVVGYTYPNVNRVWMNNKYFSKNSPALVTTNMMHEWLHKLGFNHAAQQTPDRKYSVPYAIGYLVRDLALQRQ
jgi:hypothetical protein